MTHRINKINLNSILLLIFSGIVFLNLGQPYAEESTQPTPPLIVLQQNKQPDPLIPLNVSFRKTYSDLRKQLLNTFTILFIASLEFKFLVLVIIAPFLL